MVASLAPKPAHVPDERVFDFDMYAPPGVAQDFHSAWKVLQAPGVPDLVWTPRNGGHWIPTRFDVIERVMSDYEAFSTRVIVLPREAGEAFPLIPSTLQPPEHRAYRSLLNGSFSPAAVASVESQIRDLVIELIERVRHRGNCNFSKEYAEILPIEIFLSMMALPLKDAERTKYWSDQLVRPDGSISFVDAVQKLYDYLEPYIDERMGGDGTDMFSRILNGKVFGRSLTKREALQLSLQVMLGGLDTVVNFMGFAMLFLARSPQHRAELVRSPELIPAAVDELFRRFPVVTNAREVVRDCQLDQVELKRGDMIAAPTTLGGIDEQRIDRPLDVDFHRDHVEHLTFGTGIHRCPGAHLARTEIRITIEEWLRRVPDFAIDPAAQVTFSGGIVGVVNALPLVWTP